MSAAKPFSFEGWEDAEFPIVCENCLGDNPALRMVKASCDRECKICARPCTAFRWQPGKKSRYKTTIICLLCAKQKNVCQVCLFDLQFGLPVQVRDRFLEGPPDGRVKTTEVDVPISRVNRDYMVNRIEQDTEIDAGYDKTMAKVTGAAALKNIARTQPYYKRNEARMCTFWLKNECSRGTACPFKHSLDQHDPELADQHIQDRYYGTNDPVAAKILQRVIPDKSAGADEGSPRKE